MLANRESTDRSEGTKRYLVKCEGCSFEYTADGRDNATTVGADHQRETRHEVVAVEVPASVKSS